MKNNDSKHYDIVVLGSGLVGASLLLALSPYPFTMAVIDKQPLLSLPTSLTAPRVFSLSEARAIALSHTSVETLKALKVWHLLEKESNPIEEVHVSSKGHFGRTRLTAADCQLKSLGAVCDADTLNYSLNQAMQDADNSVEIERYQPDEIQTCCREQDSWNIVLASGKTFTAKLLVGADGTESFLRKRCGVDASTENYAQQAIVSNLILDRAHNNIAYERFLTNSHPSDVLSLALLPFGENRMKSVLVCSEIESNALMNLEEKKYLEILQQNFGFRLGRFKALGKRYAYPLKRMSAEALYGPGWVLIGNAANTLHPLAAQGFNLGLRDVDLLSKILGQAGQDCENISAPSVLQRFAEGRRKDHFYTHLFTETMVKEKKSMHWGIIAAEFLSPLKKRIIHQGLGANVG